MYSNIISVYCVDVGSTDTIDNVNNNNGVDTDSETVSIQLNQLKVE